MERFDFVPDWLAALGQQQQAPSGRELMASQRARREVNTPSQGKAGTGGMENRKKRAAFLGGSGAPRNPRWRLEREEEGSEGDEASSGYEV